MSAPLGPGSPLGPFRIAAELGRGGMGVVYRAIDTRLDRPVALKVIRSDASADPRFVQRFWREAKTAARVSHPNAVRVFEAGEHQGALYIASELMPGGSLADRLKKNGALPWRDAARTGAAIARGLAAIHAAGIVHRDVKPANVLLDASGAPQVCDFGLCRLDENPGADGSTSLKLTQDGERLGTLAYMAPEQIEGQRVDHRADLYALGATLHVLVAGRTPFEGDEVALVKRALMDEPPRLRSLVPDAPRELEALVLRLLAKEPGARPTNAEAVARELDEIARPESPPPQAKGPPVALVAGGVIVVVGLVAAFALGSHERKPESSPPPVKPSASPETPRPSPAKPSPSPAASPSPGPSAEASPAASPWAVRRASVPRAEWSALLPALAVNGFKGSRLELTNVLDVDPTIRRAHRDPNSAAIACAPATGLGAASTFPGRVVIFRLSDLAPLEEIDRPATERKENSITGLSWNTKGDGLVVSIRDGSVWLYDVRSDGSRPRPGWQAKVPRGGAVRATFTPDDRGLVSQTDEGKLGWFDFEKSPSTPRFTYFESGKDRVYDFCVCPGQGWHVAVATRTGRVLIVDAATGQIERELAKHAGPPPTPGDCHTKEPLAYVSMSRDGVLSGGNDGTIRFETIGGALVKELEPTSELRFVRVTPDGRWALTGHFESVRTFHYSIRLWDLSSSSAQETDKIPLEGLGLQPEGLALLPDAVFVETRHGYVLRFALR